MAPPSTVLHLLVISALLLQWAPSATFASVIPTELLDFIHTVTSQGQDLQPVAQGITTLDGELIRELQGAYPRILAGLEDMDTKLNNMAVKAKWTEPFKGSDAQAVATAVRELVHEHEALLNILKDKAALDFADPFLIEGPVVVALGDYEASMDRFLSLTSDIASAETESIIAQQKSLHDTIEAAINAYEPGPFLVQ